MKKVILLVSVLFLVYACSSESKNYMETAGSAMSDYAEAKEMAQQIEPETETYDESGGEGEAEEQAGNFETQRIIKTANYRFEVKDVEQSSGEIGEKVKAHGGFISQSNQTSSTRRLHKNMTIRVPSDEFGRLLDALSGESIFTNYKRINSVDVSEEFFDITTRLKTKKEVRDRYIEILRNKAKTVEEIILAEEKIRILQEEIEAKEGRLKFLKNQVALSTIHLEIYQKVKYVSQQDIYERPFWGSVKEAFWDGWGLVGDIMLGILQIWPILLLLIFGIWKRHWIRRLFGR